jgi:hypothetical protein
LAFLIDLLKTISKRSVNLRLQVELQRRRKKEAEAIINKLSEINIMLLVDGESDTTHGIALREEVSISHAANPAV